MNVGQPVQTVWVLKSEDPDGNSAVYGVFSTDEKAVATWRKLVTEQELVVWSEQLGAEVEGELDAVTHEKYYVGDDPELDMTATYWSVRAHYLDQLVG